MTATALEGEVALVTGAETEIGRAVALNLGVRGATVAVASERDATLQAVRRRMGRAGVEGPILALDTTEVAGFSAVVSSVVNRFGRIDHVVNHAGIDAETRALAETDPEAFRESLDLTLHGMAACMHEAIPHILANGGGTVVNVVANDDTALCDRPSPAVAAKYGVMGLTKTAAVEYAEDNVLITALCPGFVETPLLDDTELDDPTNRARVEALDPVDRFNDTREVASGIAWLCTGDPPFLPNSAGTTKPDSVAR